MLFQGAALRDELTNICIDCLQTDPHCFSLWRDLYTQNLPRTRFKQCCFASLSQTKLMLYCQARLVDHFQGLFDDSLKKHANLEISQ